ncbi:phosphomannomutase [Roseinatronobacter sp. NSM]|uniref:phosphomannomutase n=1 Tax=Roseinatronobacter sp. NSM TaxID=3457785 RepID=UPI0040355C55
MPPAFGTSGLRGLVSELTDDVITDIVRAYLAICQHGGTVIVGWDLRPSSPGIAETVLAAIRAAGVQPVRAGAVPTPALAAAAAARGCGAVMVTGSHIPADRNGLKFYTTAGEISKHDEQAIQAASGQEWPLARTLPDVEDAPGVAAAYVARFVSAYGPHALSGLRIGVYQHSSVARDLMMDLFAGLGASAVPLARADHFIPVDTEAVAAETRAQLAAWCAEHRLDALVSTDGDADRPLLCDAQGNVVAGDVLGVLTARALGADVVCTPVSSNSMVGMIPEFTAVHRTRIGSPYVLAAMDAVLAADPTSRVVGYEANGGFLLGFAAAGPAGPLPPLMTRDSMLPVIAPMAFTHAKGQGVGGLLRELPDRFTASDRVQGIPTDASSRLIHRLSVDARARAEFFDAGTPEAGLDLTDGLRVLFADGLVVHLRPSGNAPECRCYTEAPTAAQAQNLLAVHLQKLRNALRDRMT